MAKSAREIPLDTKNDVKFKTCSRLSTTRLRRCLDHCFIRCGLTAISERGISRLRLTVTRRASRSIQRECLDILPNAIPRVIATRNKQADSFALHTETASFTVPINPYHFCLMFTDYPLLHCLGDCTKPSTAQAVSATNRSILYWRLF